MKQATMLYKYPGKEEMFGGKFDYTIVDAAQDGAIEAALAEGWHLTTVEAKEAVKPIDINSPAFPETEDPRTIAEVDTQIKSENEATLQPELTEDNQPATREELETQAAELGIKFDGRTSDSKLSALIEAALAS